ncbi:MULTISPECIES: TetR/AcrR family transcriptional regulator [Microbacterium]|jgi:AcrR family transcriptional regulator|uniref:TetR/AcrR family transcriptional regulator n=1 Tax=Microbacterium TaxID=33882 RepID=UPI001D17CD95|nr:TetR/AcrR family transcriptional regulator [Microbacterium testaceum]MCC4249932.1 TetR/AcrR family transcriptional regulator [Microbacterium testaceum]
MTTAPERTVNEAPRLGRKRDLSRDPEILEAALDVLAETGFERMTIDEVATRARAGKATLYRRWASKADLVIDAVACMKKGAYDVSALPDTGTLRGDLVAMIKEPSIADAQRKMRVMAGIVSMLSTSPELAEVAEEALVAPRRAANRVLIERAIARGEISGDVDVDLISSIGSAMVAQRLLMERKPVTRSFLVSIVDRIVLPALGLPAHG